MKTKTFYAVVKIQVEYDDKVDEDELEEFLEDADYNFALNQEDCKIVDTEWVGITENDPL